MQTKLAFTADIVPTETNERYFIEGNIDHLFGDELINYLASVDFRCFNLETPLTDNPNPAKYPGPHLMAKPGTVHAIKKLDPSLITLGNNHALDQGREGLQSTMRVLGESGIAFTGVGDDLKAADRAFSAEIGGRKVGIYNCSEYEFAAATETGCGVNPYDPLVSFDTVKQTSLHNDITIVLYHGGKEFYRYPSPQLQRICRKFVDSGADLVICQHTHCIGCEERHGNGTIVYGQGNFLFDRKEDEYKRTGMIVECEIPDTGAPVVHYFPFVKQNECVRMAGEAEAREILDAFRARSEEILRPGFIEESYSRLADQYLEEYTRKIIGGNKLVRLLNKISGGALFRKAFSDPATALRVLNVISPENHAELFKAGLRRRGGR